MEEELLQFVWETRSFQAQGWHTLAGEPVEVIHPGTLNRDQGPDFLYAHVRIKGRDHFGHVEIHVDSRDWYRHGHHKDPNYNPVVLHVVLRPQLRPVLREDGTEIPEASLEGRILEGIQTGRKHLLKGHEHLPCGELLGKAPSRLWKAWMEERGAIRLEQKVREIRQRMDDPEVDWEQALWETLAGAMGGPVNKEAFLAIAERLPVHVLRRYASEVQSREALLFGVAGGLVGEAKDDYHRALQGEWRFLSSLHGLSPSLSAMRFHRMRPGAFPTFRLSQLGGLASKFPSWVGLLRPAAMREFVKGGVQAAAYWRTHVHFGRQGGHGKKEVRAAYMKVVFLNSLAPMGIHYARAHGRADIEQEIKCLLHDLPPEKNRITNHFERCGAPAASAWESQAQINLFKSHCKEKRCLDCVVGRWIVGGGASRLKKSTLKKEQEVAR